jgi:hypothetical protein
MPPPGGMPGIGGVSFLGFSATIASVVTSSPAIEAASCSTVRTTLVGSIRRRSSGSMRADSAVEPTRTRLGRGPIVDVNEFEVSALVVKGY